MAYNCSECGCKPVLTSGERIYPNRPELFIKKFYLCKCGAYVGCHNGTYNALGSPAGFELRKLRMDVHALFDPLWKRKMTFGFTKKDARNRGYAWLAKEMDIELKKCHVSQFNLSQCRQALKILNNLKRTKS